MKKVLKVFLTIILVIGVIAGGFAVANLINRSSMTSYIDSFQPVSKENQLTPEYDENGVPYFVTDGDFKVMHLTDIHLGGGILSAGKDKKAINAVAAMVSAEKPDLVVITGDISFAVPTAGTFNNRYAHEYFIRLMERLGVYWTVTFGNHDSEKYNYHGRDKVADFYSSESLKYCLFDKGPDDIFGSCNHIINVRNSKGLITKTLVMMDTNAYTDDDPLGLGWEYDNIHEDQINWYKNTILSLNDYNKSVLDAMPESERPENIDNFTTVQSMLFVHIPLKEVRNAYEEYVAAGEKDTDDVKYIWGVIGEESAPYIYPSEIEEEMFETMLALGSTKAMFYGHDHLNNMVMEYKGITLSYGYSVDYFAYWQIARKGWQRGCSVINCHPDTTFEIIHENYYQDKYQPLYEKEVVDMTP